MKVKLDTKEKFHVITILEPVLSANMTEELKEMLLLNLDKPIKNVILNLSEIREMDKPSAKTIIDIQQTFYDANSSFVICGLTKPVEKFIDNLELLELMNVTPSETEAWDIVQMEEIERELYDEE